MAHISSASMSGRTVSRDNSLGAAVSSSNGDQTLSNTECRDFAVTEDLNPTNPLVCALLTDMYQISMTYAHWKNGKADDHAVFDLFFRKSPFQGEFCVFAGTDEVVKFLSSYSFSLSDVNYLKQIMPSDCEEEFFNWLLSVSCRDLKVYAITEGSVVFPREPLLRIEGPLGIAQLVETTLLNLVNYPSLVATCAARMRLVAGDSKRLLEFGLRRAQGPDGAISASKYSVIGGFDGTSNVLAGKMFDLSVAGTHGHAYIMSYITFADLPSTTIASPTDKTVQIEFKNLVLQKRLLFEDLGFCKTNEGELAAFVSYAQAFPNGFLALVDTYDTLSSGVKNFVCVSLALIDIGYAPRGIRLDSGDLAYLSTECRKLFREVDTRLGKNALTDLMISASNDINEKVLAALDKQGHEIDCFGIGTHLVTCQSQPALGCVYKLVEVKGNPRIKLSQEIEKLVVPCKKAVYRLYGKDGVAILDVIQMSTEPPPAVGKPILCRHPFESHKTCRVTPSRVEELLSLLWENGSPVRPISTIAEVRAHRANQMTFMRNDILRTTNPTPYKVSLSETLFQFMHALWQEYAPTRHFE